MKRFILAVPPDGEGRVHLSGKDYHYLARVRRLGPGDVFEALLPGGGEVRLRVSSLDGARLSACCLSAGPPAEEPRPPASVPPLVLFQALPKGTKMDLIVRQAAEGGVAEVVPFVSAHSVPPASAERAERWRRIVKEARQQSGSLTPTLVRQPMTLEALVGHWETLRRKEPAALGLLLHQDPLEQGSFHGYLENGPSLVALAVGPEGGFSPAEAETFRAAGFRPLVMGDTVLRTETAALYAAAAARIILLERASWMLKTPENRNE